MILFSRRAVLSGSPLKTTAAATAVTEHINGLVDAEIALWVAGAGFPVGSFAWTSRFDSHVDLTEQMGRLTADETADSLIGTVRSMAVAPPEDSIQQMIHGNADAPAPPVGAVANVTTATIALESLAEAMAWGVGMAELATEVTGNPVGFFQHLYGPFGQVSWITATAGMAGVDAAQAALAGNEEYLGRVAAGASLFIPGSGSQGIATRIA